MKIGMCLLFEDNQGCRLDRFRRCAGWAVPDCPGAASSWHAARQYRQCGPWGAALGQLVHRLFYRWIPSAKEKHVHTSSPHGVENFWFRTHRRSDRPGFIVLMLSTPNIYVHILSSIVMRKTTSGEEGPHILKHISADEFLCWPGAPLTNNGLAFLYRSRS